LASQLYDIITPLCHRVVDSHDHLTPFHDLYQALKNFFPLDMINIPAIDPQSENLRYMVLVTDDGTMLVDETVKLSMGARRMAMEAIAKKIIVWNDSSRNDLMQEVAAHMEVREATSTLVLTIPIGSARHGAFGLVAMGAQRYKDHHRKALESISEPLSGLISHTLSQLEIKKLKESLLTQNIELRRRMGFMSATQIIGRTTGLKAVLDQVSQVAPLETLVLLVGETGVGKEAVAHAIHRLSPRSDGPLVSLNCGAIPETLLESELFGYEKGAFTGAEGLKRGYFEQADGGTIFLDEISELSLPAQVKLLRLLQAMEFHRVGGSRTISINVRVIAATNRNLDTMVKKGQFRSDLWFRINVFPIHIPPLRERKEDLLPLADYFIRRKSLEMNIPGRFSLGQDALEQLQNYDWPGNVRELQNVIERALILCREGELTFPNLSPPSAKPAEEADPFENGQFPSMVEMTRLHIRRSLVASKGRVSGPGGAAELLKMNPSTLRAQMRKLGISLRRLPA
jgi:transcriptional regulator with GAF, ATPase, and Fis domain